MLIEQSGLNSFLLTNIDRAVVRPVIYCKAERNTLFPAPVSPVIVMKVGEDEKQTSACANTPQLDKVKDFKN
jgi:hypothetical protein